MSLIRVKNLSRSFRIYKKEPGLLGSIQSLINRQYYDSKAVDDISFEVNKGELIGFIGPNGAVLPIMLVVSTPAKSLLNKILAGDVAGLIILSAVMFFASRRFWKYALRHYTSASG